MDDGDEELPEMLRLVDELIPKIVGEEMSEEKPIDYDYIFFQSWVGMPPMDRGDSYKEIGISILYDGNKKTFENIERNMVKIDDDWVYYYKIDNGKFFVMKESYNSKSMLNIFVFLN